MKTSRLLLTRYATRKGYFVSGNHIFDAAAWSRINAGRWASSVDERPELHGREIVRAADILQRTYLR